MCAAEPVRLYPFCVASDDHDEETSGLQRSSELIYSQMLQRSKNLEKSFSCSAESHIECR